MLHPWSRVGDIGVGTCSIHGAPKTTVLITGANSVLLNKIVSATYISLGIASCGDISVVVTRSMTVRAESNGAHRITDTGLIVSGVYEMVTGSPNVLAGD